MRSVGVYHGLGTNVILCIDTRLLERTRWEESDSEKKEQDVEVLCRKDSEDRVFVRTPPKVETSSHQNCNSFSKFERHRVEGETILLL